MNYCVGTTDMDAATNFYDQPLSQSVQQVLIPDIRPE